MAFLTKLITEAGRGDKSVLVEELHYQVPGTQTIIQVPKGFVTDMASIPRGFRWLVTGNDNTRKPAVVHDYLYARKIYNRKRSDEIFDMAMRDAGVLWWMRKLCYLAVRAGGWVKWNK